MVTVIVQFRAAAGRADELQALLEHGRDVSRAADGCESFELYRRGDDPDRFVFLERWTSIDAHHANMASNIVATGHLAKIQQVIDGPIDNGVLVPV